MVLKGIDKATLENRTALQLKQLVKHWIEANVPIEIVRLAEEAGHRVLFTPPYHSDLQPIELVWARIKGNIGRQYTTGTTISVVYDRLMHEFGKLEQDGTPIGRMIEKCATIAQDFYNDMDEDNLEEQDDEEEEEEEDDEDGDVENDDDDEVLEEEPVDRQDDDDNDEDSDNVDDDPLSYVEDVEFV